MPQMSNVLREYAIGMLTAGMSTRAVARDLNYHFFTTCRITIMHGPMSHGSLHNSWNLKMFQLFNGLYTHLTCHPLSMFGMLWIYVYDSVFQFLPISSNFTQPLKRSGTTFHRPQSTV
jgi:hypothetical protein